MPHIPHRWWHRGVPDDGSSHGRIPLVDGASVKPAACQIEGHFVSLRGAVGNMNVPSGAIVKSHLPAHSRNRPVRVGAERNGHIVGRDKRPTNLGREYGVVKVVARLHLRKASVLV